MPVVINGPWLQAELDRRGLTQLQFARLVPCAYNTVSAALAGKAVQQVVLRRMAVALQNTPVVETIDQLVAR